MTMTRLTLGDMAQANLMQLSQARIKSDLLRLSTELTTGIRAAPNPTLGGDITPLSALHRSRATIAPWQGAAREAATAFDAAQTALGSFQSIASNLALSSFDATGQGTEADIDQLAIAARADFGRLVATLNTATAGRSLFAGTATDRPALADGDTILAQISAAATTAGAVTTTDYIAVVDDFFDTGGDLETLAYLGEDAAGSVRISPDNAVSPLPTAHATELRATLRAAALAALAGDDTLGLTATDREILVATAGQDLMSAESGLVTLRARLGHDQQAIEMAATRLAAEAHALDLAIAELTAADPYDTAAALEATQVQLETLYAVQARLASLGLAGYLR